MVALKLESFFLYLENSLYVGNFYIFYSKYLNNLLNNGKSFGLQLHVCNLVGKQIGFLLKSLAVQIKAIFSENVYVSSFVEISQSHLAVFLMLTCDTK